jgi:hypothetical protein
MAATSKQLLRVLFMLAGTTALLRLSNFAQSGPEFVRQVGA